jgi:biopolymer transport protein ExbD
MRTRFRWTLGVLVLATSHTFAAVEYCGFMFNARTAYFVLRNAETGRHSAWLTVGETFDGYTINAYDGERELLTLQHGSSSITLALKTPKTSEGNAQPAGNIIHVSIAGNSSITVRDDPAMLETLKLELLRLAALDAQPIVTIRTSEKTELAFVRAILDLCKECGIKKVSFASRSDSNRPQ